MQRLLITAEEAPPQAGASDGDRFSSPFTIGVADGMGREIPPDANGFSDPGSERARSLVFDLHTENGPTTEDMKFSRDLEKFERALGQLYPETGPANEAKFRPYFTRLFHLSQLILEGDVGKDANGKKAVVGKRLSSEAAKAEIEALGADLIDDEAPRVKNQRVRELVGCAARLGTFFVAGYAALSFAAIDQRLTAFLGHLRVEALAASNFMLLWVGAFVGVCLSYAIRTHEFSLVDLTRGEGDYLAPQYRLLLTGALAMVLTMIAIIGLGDIEFGSIKLSDAAASPQVAFVLGAILGIGEKSLSGTVEKRVGGLLAGGTK